MTADFSPADMVWLYRDRIKELLAERGMTSPRLCGLAAGGGPLPATVPIEILVEIGGIHDWLAVDTYGPADAVSDLVGHPVCLVHAPVGRESLLPGEALVAL